MVGPICPGQFSSAQGKKKKKKKRGWCAGLPGWHEKVWKWCCLPACDVTSPLVMSPPHLWCHLPACDVTVTVRHRQRRVSLHSSPEASCSRVHLSCSSSWGAAVYGVAQSRTRLKWLSSSSSSSSFLGLYTKLCLELSSILCWFIWKYAVSVTGVLLYVFTYTCIHM